MKKEKEMVCEIIAELRQAKTARAAREARHELLAHALYGKCADARILAATAICAPH